MPLNQQVMIIFAGTNGYLDKVPVDRVKEWETGFLRFMETQHPEVGQAILRDLRLNEDTEKALRTAAEEFNLSWS
jgi:F-type H+-transporting ATPase subunit alpha